MKILKNYAVDALDALERVGAQDKFAKFAKLELMNTLPSELSHPAIALDKPATDTPASAEAPATAAAPAPSPTSSIPLISAFSTGTQRQMELTINAMARSVRKAIRRAENLERDGNYAEAAKAWLQVNQRTAMLQELSRTFTTAVAVTVTVAPQPQPQPQIESAPAPVPNIDEDQAAIKAMQEELARLVRTVAPNPFVENEKQIAVADLQARIHKARQRLAARQK